MKVSPNFSEREFACKGQDCCDGMTMLNFELIGVLQRLRNHFDDSVTITSSYRCPIHNKRVGGVSNSQHMLGTAADIQVKYISPMNVAAYLDELYPNTYGIGTYNTFTHIDVRTTKARWNYVSV
jgi:uncharacterized protein YcbK (DUF882 family)